MDPRFGERLGRRRDRQGAAVGHGVPGVDRQVQHHLFDLPGVDLHGAQVAGQIAGQVDVLAEHAGQHPLERQHGGVEIEHLGHQQLSPAEGEQLPGQRRRPVGGATDAAGEPAPRRARQPLGIERLGVAADDLQQVVEVMGDAAGEPAERADLLGPPQLFGEVAILLQGPLEAGGEAGVVVGRRRAVAGRVRTRRDDSAGDDSCRGTHGFLILQSAAAAAA